MHDAMQAINDSVAIYLFRTGKSRTKLAEEMGMSRWTLTGKLASGKLTLQEVERLCNITGLDIHAVFDGRR